MEFSGNLFGVESSKLVAPKLLQHIVSLASLRNWEDEYNSMNNQSLFKWACLAQRTCSPRSIPGLKLHPGYHFRGGGAMHKLVGE